MQEFDAWRDPETKEIIKKEPVRLCRISEWDIERMNRQGLSAFINGDKGKPQKYYERVRAAKKPAEPKKEK